MTTTSTLTRSLLALTCALTLSGPLSSGHALAAPAPAPASADARFEALLVAIDVIPASREQLERAFPDARARLLAAAADDRRDQWTRARAIAFLGFYPDAGVRAALEGLAGHRQPEVRQRAIYRLARAFGQPGDGRLVALVERATGDPDAEVAEAAVRGLRWIDRDEAKASLERVAASARAPEALRSLARATLARRSERLRGAP